MRKNSWLLWTLVIFAGLAVDQCFQPWGQYFVDAGIWLAFAALVATSPRAERWRYLYCLLVATAGEILLCDCLGIYAYREGVIPLFVPPGHVLLYAAGLALAPRLHERLWLAILVAGVTYCGWCLYCGRDQLSVLLFGLWCLIAVRQELRPLVSAMILLALGMELYGTSLGNWRWAGAVPFLNFSLSQNNPPFAVGVFYCGLDFLVAILLALTPGEKTSPGAYDKIVGRRNLETNSERHKEAHI